MQLPATTSEETAAPAPEQEAVPGWGRQTLRNARKFDGAAEERLFPLLLSDPRQLNAG